MKKRSLAAVFMCFALALGACGQKEGSETEEAAAADRSAVSPQELSDTIDKVAEESRQQEVLNGEIFEFYIDSDVNIVKLQMPANFVREDAEHTGSSFETNFDLVGDERAHYEMKISVLSMEEVKGPLEYLEARYPNDILGSTRTPCVDPHGQEGSYKAIYKESVSDGFKSAEVSMHGEKTIGFGHGSNETAAVLYIETKITNCTGLSYDSIYKVLDSILLDNVDDGEVRSVIDRVAAEDEEEYEEKMKDGIVITNEAVCKDICSELGLKETNKFTREQLEKVYDVDFSVLRDEDSEWLPYLNMIDREYIYFYDNPNITDLSVLENWLPTDWDSELDIQIKIDNCENLTSLAGAEELFGAENVRIQQLQIENCPGLADISALKEIRACDEIRMESNPLLTDISVLKELKDCSRVYVVRGWEEEPPFISDEMIADVYDSNPNIGVFTVGKHTSRSMSVEDYSLNYH